MPKSKSITLRNISSQLAGNIFRLKTLLKHKTASGAVKEAIEGYMDLKDETERLHLENNRLKIEAELLQEKLDSCTEAIRNHLHLSQSMEDLTENMKGIIRAIDKESP